MLKDASLKCVKCAKCIPTCTIYGVNKDETTSPRGYLDIISSYANKELELDLNLKNAIESCFLCTTCVSVCPASLPVDVMVTRMRVDIAKKYGIPFYKKIIFNLLANRSMLNLIFKIGFYFSPCALKKKDSKNILRFSKFKNRVIFPLKPKSFLNSFKELIPSSINTQNLPKNKVAIYIGCLSNYHYLEVGKALVNILKFLDISVFIPKKQACCGAPAYFSGDIDSTIKLIYKNLDYFNSFIDDVDAILIPEATCAAMVITDWIHALEIHSDSTNTNNTSYIALAKKLKLKTFMASKWLYSYTNLNSHIKNANLVDTSITYHDPCHAKKVLNVFKEPRELLANYKLIEMENSNACCGFGGVSIQSEKYSLAKQVGDKKALMIKQSDASVVSAECSACRMQIEDSLHRNDIKTKFMHPLELIAKGLNLA